MSGIKACKAKGGTLQMYAQQSTFISPPKQKHVFKKERRKKEETVSCLNGHIHIQILTDNLLTKPKHDCLYIGKLQNVRHYTNHYKTIC